MELSSTWPNLIKQQTTDWVPTCQHGNTTTKTTTATIVVHTATAGIGYENLNPTDSGGDKLRMLLPAIVHRVRHHAADPVPAEMLCDLFKNAILLRHIDGDGNIHPGTATTFPTSKFYVECAYMREGGGTLFGASRRPQPFMESRTWAH